MGDGVPAWNEIWNDGVLIERSFLEDEVRRLPVKVSRPMFRQYNEARISGVAKIRVNDWVKGVREEITDLRSEVHSRSYCRIVHSCRAYTVRHLKCETAIYSTGRSRCFDQGPSLLTTFAFEDECFPTDQMNPRRI